MAKFSLGMAIPPVAFAGLAALFIFGMNRDDPDQLPSASVGKPAPSLAQVAALGEFTPVMDENLRETSSGVKLVNYWASWCAPCRIEHAQLQALSREGIEIFGINYKDQADGAVRFLTELGNPYAAVGADKAGRTALEWGVYGVPETYVVNAKGEVTYRFAGPITPEILDKYIRPEIEAARETHP
jgi:cytochrome c biogenesis protein CcmG/thiol:disulfide interchange protein DsbE